MEWAAQGDGGVSVPVRIQEKIGCGTQHHGLVDKVPLGHSLDTMISKVFSNPFDSLILVLS